MKTNVEVKAYRTMFDVNKPITGPDGTVSYPAMRDDKGEKIRTVKNGHTVELEDGDIPDEYLEPIAEALGVGVDVLIADMNGGIRLATQKRLAEDIVVGGQPSVQAMKKALAAVVAETKDMELMEIVVLGKKEVIAKAYLKYCSA